MSEAPRFSDEELERYLAMSDEERLSDEEVRGVLFRQLYGDDLFRKVWPKAPLLDL